MENRENLEIRLSIDARNTITQSFFRHGTPHDISSELSNMAEESLIFGRRVSKSTRDYDFYAISGDSFSSTDGRYRGSICKHLNIVAKSRGAENSSAMTVCQSRDGWIVSDEQFGQAIDN
jgi:hypothetical protein